MPALRYVRSLLRPQRHPSPACHAFVALFMGLALGACGSGTTGEGDASSLVEGSAAGAGVELQPAGDAEHYGARLLPAFSLPTLDGGQLTTSDLAGSSVVLHFWAPWSTPSLKDLPVLDSLHALPAYAHVRVVGVLETDGTLDEARALVDSLGIRYPIVVDEAGSVAASLDRVTMLPTTFYFDRTGRLVHDRVGAFSSAGAAENTLRFVTDDEAQPDDATPQVHALSLERAQQLVAEGALVLDVRAPEERVANDPLARATPAPLATLVPEQLPSDPQAPLLFVSDTSGTRAQLAAEQALAWGHRRVFFARGNLVGLFRENG
ncbi:MAG: redoxin domain-containing protein [Bacteroidota bacterium]